MGTEKHYGLGVLDGKVIVAATYAGYPITARNSANLIAVARAGRRGDPERHELARLA